TEPSPRARSRHLGRATPTMAPRPSPVSPEPASPEPWTELSGRGGRPAAGPGDVAAPARPASAPRRDRSSPADLAAGSSAPRAPKNRRDAALRRRLLPGPARVAGTPPP